MNKQKKILICPLDWGLGHATRCMPLIKYFIEKGCKVIVAGNQKTNQLIQQEFPEIPWCIELAGYNVRYASSKFLLPLKIFMQIPGLLNIIKYEHNRLQGIVDMFSIDLVISDNRYGFYTDKVPCIFITHQLQIAVPQSRFLEKIVNKINHRYIRKFSEVWVPDYEDHTMAGRLSHADKLGHVKYIGNLSRFEKGTKTETLYDKIIILSGPEPQRTALEKIVLAQIMDTQERVILVRGKPDETSHKHDNQNIIIENHLSKNEMQYAIMQSEMIICRSGYSSIMDLLKLGKHALLIPTPGQTEQEYLAKYLAEKKWFITSAQKGFDLAKESVRFKSFQFNPFPDKEMDQFKSVIDNFLC